jgi:hypothetical protein
MVRAMNRYGAAAVMWGIAAGAFAYRYAMMPLDWGSPWRHVLPGLAIGLAVAAHQLVRSDIGKSKRPALWTLLGAGACGALIAFGLAYVAFPTLDRSALSVRRFPGFSLAIPDGEVIDDRGDYNNGKLALKRVGNSTGVLFVQWELGTLLEPAELQVLAGVMSKALEVEGTGRVEKLPAGSAGTPTDSIVFGTDRAQFVLSMMPCGVRHVMVATGSAEDTMVLHKRIIASFACEPVAALESTAELRFPLELDLPGWYVSEREIDQLVITDDTTGSLTLRSADKNLKVDLGIIIEPMFKAAGLEARITGRDGERISFTMQDGSDSIDGWARLVRCPDATAIVIGVAVNLAALDDLDKRVKSGRCLRPGEPAQKWPDPPEAPAPPAAPN